MMDAPRCASVSAFSFSCIFVCPEIHGSTSFIGLVVRKLCISLARLRIEEVLYFSAARAWSTDFESLIMTTLCSSFRSNVLSIGWD